jgi:hypothetical protein
MVAPSPSVTPVAATAFDACSEPRVEVLSLRRDGGADDGLGERLDRPTAQWSRLNTGRSDDLGNTGSTA